MAEFRVELPAGMSPSLQLFLTDIGTSWRQRRTKPRPIPASWASSGPSSHQVGRVWPIWERFRPVSGRFGQCLNDLDDSSGPILGQNPPEVLCHDNPFRTLGGMHAAEHSLIGRSLRGWGKAWGGFEKTRPVSRRGES